MTDRYAPAKPPSSPTPANSHSATERARQYYNSHDADRFYATIWGGQDIHIGLYQAADEPIKEASRRSVEHLADRLNPIQTGARVIDLGAGYGGAARRLVERFGCQVTCLNLSETENRRNRELTTAAGLDESIEVIDGSFEQIPLPAASCQAAWSQDALLHAGDRLAVFREVDRVLTPGGRFGFTDPMQADHCPDGVLAPILERIHLDTLGSPGTYRQMAESLGWHDLGFEDHTEQLSQHYRRVLETMQARRSELRQTISEEYLQRMAVGLQHWIDGGQNGHLRWGFWVFSKPLV